MCWRCPTMLAVERLAAFGQYIHLETCRVDSENLWRFSRSRVKEFFSRKTCDTITNSGVVSVIVCRLFNPHLPSLPSFQHCGKPT